MDFLRSQIKYEVPLAGGDTAQSPWIAAVVVNAKSPAIGGVRPGADGYRSAGHCAARSGASTIDGEGAVTASMSPGILAVRRPNWNSWRKTLGGYGARQLQLLDAG